MSYRALVFCFVCLLFSACALCAEGVGAVEPQGCAGNFGLNGNQCCYNTFAQALANASNGDTLFIGGGDQVINEFMGVIDIDLTITPGKPGAPAFSGCEVLDPNYSPDIVFDMNFASQGTHGGMLQVTNGAEVELRRIDLQNASATFGGLIAVLDGAHLELVGVNLSGGVANHSGGNIYVEGSIGNLSHLRMLSGDVVNGSANINGGAIAAINAYVDTSNADFGIDASFFNAAGTFGGAIYAVDSTLDIFGGRVFNNIGGVSGGGFYIVGGTASITAGLYRNNQTFGSSTGQGGAGMYLGGGLNAVLDAVNLQSNVSFGNGGGLMITTDAAVQLTDNSTVRLNTAVNGGGIWSDAALMLDAVVVETNTAEELGGGIHCQQCPSIDIGGVSEVSNNQAMNGGGIYFDGLLADSLLAVSSTQFTDNLADAAEGEGGAVYMNQGHLSVLQSGFNGNSAVYTGGAISAPASRTGAVDRITLHQSLFDGNSTTDGVFFGPGGSVLRASNVDEVLVSNSVFNNNSSTASGTLSFNVSTLNLTDSSFSDNTHGRYGAVNLQSTPYQIERTQFNNNTAAFNGGALRLNNSNGQVDSALFVNNSADDGGAISVQSCTGNLRVINSQFSSNTAVDNGGAIHLQGCDLILEARIGADEPVYCNPADLPFDSFCNAFINNQANRGGALYTDVLANSTVYTVDLHQALFRDNTAVDAGAMVHVVGTNGRITLNNVLGHHNGSVTDENTLMDVAANNRLELHSVSVADNLGQPVRIDGVGSEIDVRNSIIQNNTLAPHAGVLVNVSESCNNVQAAGTGSQSIGANLGDPMFTSDARSAYALAAGAPGRDACNSGLMHDVDGKLRPNSGGQYDRGAFEMDGIGTEDIIFQHGFGL